jgi:hypothetical protein
LSGQGEGPDLPRGRLRSADYFVNGGFAGVPPILGILFRPAYAGGSKRCVRVSGGRQYLARLADEDGPGSSGSDVYSEEFDNGSPEAPVRTPATIVITKSFTCQQLIRTGGKRERAFYRGLADLM